MTYSCSDFYDDVMRCMVDAGVVDDSKRGDGADAVGVDADLAIDAIARLTRMNAVSRFLDELLPFAATPANFAERYDADALALLTYLQRAIFRVSRVEVPRSASAFLELIHAMPSASEWLRYVELVD